ncbi:MAG: glutamate-5-semialdehyde dehydrogenase [bacterium]
MTTKTTDVTTLAKQARSAYRTLSTLDTGVKNEALEAVAVELRKRRDEILEANEKDLEYGREEGLSDALLDRLQLTPDRLDGMADGIRDVIKLDDPVGEVVESSKRPNGLKVGRQRVPLGVIGMIYESRPNVTVDATVLCLKSGNSILLRGGSEAKHTNYLLVDIMQDALGDHLPEESVQILRSQDHELVDQMLSEDDNIDVIIPRGGETLIERVAEESKIPVIKHYKGICHVYVSASADLDMAMDICLNAKTQRTSVCNAMETLLLSDELPDGFLNDLFSRLEDNGVELRVDGDLFGQSDRFEADFKEANSEDWDTEYLDSILSVRRVGSLDQAIEHINEHGNHSDAIVTDRYEESQQFIDRVDSAAVYVNASTRFTDGYEFGLGAEIGISTDRLHCRGPMGLRELTIPKYTVFGDGQVRT